MESVPACQHANTQYTQHTCKMYSFVIYHGSAAVSSTPTTRMGYAVPICHFQKA
jgi:hypothetical protein